MQTVAFVGDPDTRINQQVAIGLSQELQRHAPWQLVMVPSTLGDAALQRALLEHDPDALVTHVGPLPDSRRDVLEALLLPWVMVATDSNPGCELPVVMPDNAGVGTMAAEFFLQQRFEHVAFLGFASSFESPRMHAFRARLEKVHCDLSTYALPAPPRKNADHPGCIEGSRERLCQWLRGLSKPCGIFAYSDLPGAYVVSACIQCGLRVPEDVSVLGADDDALFCHSVCPNLASIHLPNARIGTEAAKVILDWHPGRRVIEVPPVTVIDRDSVRSPAIHDPLVNQALEYVRAHVAEGVRVRDLQKLTGLTPSMLVYRFRESIQRTPMEEILLQRIRLARHLLNETDVPVSEVATRCGFNSANQFYVTFRRQVGTSPVQYRAQFAW